ncbi:hypothetical protein [Streptomyces sp. NPDC090445]|uniref:hypothetical protein n=1 Tax=Streptomyces sp. NPDC090445 TaxID=3365963 RepID=UPI0038002257
MGAGEGDGEDGEALAQVLQAFDGRQCLLLGGRVNGFRKADGGFVGECHILGGRLPQPVSELCLGFLSEIGDLRAHACAVLLPGRGMRVMRDARPLPC